MTCEPFTLAAWLGLLCLAVNLLAGAIVLVAIMLRRRDQPAMRTADADQIERETRAAQRRAGTARLARMEAAHAGPPRAAAEPARSPLTQHDRAAIARRARATAAADFHHEHRRSGNPYPRHSPAFALYAVEYAAAWTSLCAPIGQPHAATPEQVQP